MRLCSLPGPAERGRPGEKLLSMFHVVGGSACPLGAGCAAARAYATPRTRTPRTASQMTARTVAHRSTPGTAARTPASRPVLVLLAAAAAALLLAARPSAAAEAPFATANVSGTLYNVSYTELTYDNSSIALIKRCEGWGRGRGW